MMTQSLMRFQNDDDSGVWPYGSVSWQQQGRTSLLYLLFHSHPLFEMNPSLSLEFLSSSWLPLSAWEVVTVSD